MCLILAGSSSLTSLVREAATKRPLQPQQPIHAGCTQQLAHIAQREREQVGRAGPRVGSFQRGAEQGIKWWGVEATSGGFDGE